MMELQYTEQLVIKVKMVYINKNTGQIASLYTLLPNYSNPYLLSEEALLNLGIEKYIQPEVEVTIEQLKKSKIEEIKSVFLQMQSEGFECSNGIKLDCREKDKINWLTVKLSAVPQPIKDFNNQVHTELSAEDISLMMQELEGYYQKLYKNKWSLEQLVQASETKEELEEIYWRKPLMDEETLETTGYEYNPLLE